MFASLYDRGSTFSGSHLCHRQVGAEAETGIRGDVSSIRPSPRSVSSKMESHVVRAHDSGLVELGFPPVSHDSNHSPPIPWSHADKAAIGLMGVGC